MRNSLLSLITGAAILAAPVSLCFAQGNPAPAAKPAGAKGDTVRAVGQQVDGIAATVGDQVILISEVEARANVFRSMGREVKSEREFAELKQEALTAMVNEELLVQKAKAEKVEASDAEVQREFDDREKKVRANFKTDAEFRAALKEAGFGSMEEWRKSQMDDLRRGNIQRDVVQKLRRDGKMTNINVSEADVVEAFEKAKDKLPPKEARVGIRQIVIPTRPSEAAKKRARAKIDSIARELALHPDDFESIAKRESMDGTKELGGDLGWNRRGRMVPEFDRIMFALNPGVVSPVVETGFGYHLIRVDRVQPAEVKARHILIRPTLDSTDEARTRALADSVANAWRKGASVDSLTIRYHDDATGEDKSIPEVNRSQLPPEYSKAIEGKALKDILDPFPIADPGTGFSKYVVAQITFLDDAGENTLADWRDRIRAQLSEERSIGRLYETLKKSTYVSVRYDPLALLPKP